jgi:iron complex outermembrane receptor protein
MKMGLLSMAALVLWATSALAQDAVLETVTVTADPVRLIEAGASDAALGLAKPLAETPRAVTLVSDTTLSRYGIDGVDALTAITPNAYTGSFYGVEGAVNLRGTQAESYFRGFKRAENRGTYATPLGDAARIDILRGPPSPIYGPGKVGGLVDFVPMTGGPDPSGREGQVSLTAGSYSKRNLAAAYGVPLALGDGAGGIRLYGELDDSFSFYRGLHPTHQLLEASGDTAWGAWSLSGDYLYYHANGDVQTPGWNRLTQSLIDSGTYVTGRDTSLTDADGNGRLTLNELGGNPYTYDPGFKPLYQPCACADAAHTLDVGVGTTHLDPRTVYIARGVDFSNTITHTGFAELGWAADNGDRLALQLFGDTLSNDRFVSYGYPGSYRTQIGELRLRYDFKRAALDGRLTLDTVAGGGYRLVRAAAKESFNSGVIALDRRDISQGPAANDIIDSPFTPDAPGLVGLGWENDIHSSTADAGLFFTSDIAWDKRFDLVLGGRYDAYNVRSIDQGVLTYGAPPRARGDAGRFTYTASLSYKTDWGLVPYVTTAKNSAIEIGQASEVSTSLLANGGWLSDSFLNEAGVKYLGMEGRLFAALDWYRQSRTQLQQALGAPVVAGTRGEGEEIELRYLAGPGISLTLAGSLQHTTVLSPPNVFAYIPARTYGVAPAAGFGGSYVTFDFASLPGKAGSYEDTLLPHAVFSPYVTYTAPDGDWGGSFGGSYVGRTRQTVPDPLTFPSYVTLNLSAFARAGLWEVRMNVNNLADARYFTPDADTYANLAALPGVGRTWQLTLTRVF